MQSPTKYSMRRIIEFVVPLTVVIALTCAVLFRIAVAGSEAGAKCVENDAVCNGLSNGGCTANGFFPPDDDGCADSDNATNSQCHWKKKISCPTDPTSTCSFGRDSFIGTNCQPGCVYVEYNIASCACGDGGSTTSETFSGGYCKQ
jgi:hypothetical protein